MTAQTRNQNGLPRRGLVSLGQTMAAVGLLLGVLTVPLDLSSHTYAGALATVLVVGMLLVRGAGRLSVGWTSAAEVVTSAVLLGWRRPTRAVWSLLTAAAGLALGAWLAGRGEPLAGLLGAGLTLASARWWLPQGAARERARTGVERAMAGALSGGLEWDAAEAAQRGAPVRVRFEGDATPVRVTAPLPPAWKAASEEDLSSEVNSRLGEWGTPWVVAVNHSERRLIVIRRGPAGDGALRRRTPCRMRRRSASAGSARLLLAGLGGWVPVPFYWDAADSPSGLSWAAWAGQVRLGAADRRSGDRSAQSTYLPERVGFPSCRRKNVEVVATSLVKSQVSSPAQTECTAATLMEKAGVQHVQDLRGLATHPHRVTSSSSWWRRIRLG